MNKKCIISFASKGREDYNKAMRRCIDNLLPNYDGDYLFFSPDGSGVHNGVEIIKGLPDGCPSHKEVPYAFKPYAFKQAFDMGYEQVLWVDSTIVAARELDESFWRYLYREGVMAFHNQGHPLRYYISDVARERTELSEGDLKGAYQIMACVVGFDIRNGDGLRIFERWYSLAVDGEAYKDYGSVRPEFKVHRHDQAVLSALMYKDMKRLLPYGKLVYQPHDTTMEFGDKFYFVNKGI